jgi:hypothetical protein
MDQLEYFCEDCRLYLTKDVEGHFVGQYPEKGGELRGGLVIGLVADERGSVIDQGGRLRGLGSDEWEKRVRGFCGGGRQVPQMRSAPQQGLRVLRWSVAEIFPLVASICGSFLGFSLLLLEIPRASRIQGSHGARGGGRSGGDDMLAFEISQDVFQGRFVGAHDAAVVGRFPEEERHRRWRIRHAVGRAMAGVGGCCVVPAASLLGIESNRIDSR